MAGAFARHAVHPSMDRYAVIGNPVSHSLSPLIHAHFARETGERLEYTALLAPLDDFAGAARRFFDDGGRGANITLPFKIDAFAFASSASERARVAGAANFLALRDERIEADNTDGAGLVADLAANHGIDLAASRILLLGAGGAARGVLGPLTDAKPRALVVANRDGSRARELAVRFGEGRVRGVSLADIPREDFDLVVNATSASIHGEAVALPAHAYVRGALAYDMAYGPKAGAFLDFAGQRGMRTSDGLGMLVEQAAESFFLWRGKRAPTAGILAKLRARAD